MEIVARRTNLISHSSACLRDISPHSTSLGVSRGSTLRNTGKLRGSKSLSWLHSNRRQSQPDGNASPSSPSTQQQTARGWLASYDNRLSQNFWSQQAGLGENSGQVVRLPPVASHSARRENFKKEQYSSDLDRIASGQGLGQKSACQSQEKRRIDRSKSYVSQLTLDEEVRRGRSLSDETDQLVHKVRHQHRHFKPQIMEVEEVRGQSKESKESKDEKREEIRHAISKDQQKRSRTSTDQPRNPRWRVEERLRKERELWRDTGEAPEKLQKLPMTQFAVQGERGKEEHAVVDIQAIQKRCRGLVVGCSAKSLLEQQRVQEEASTSKKSVDRSCHPELEALASLTWEDRVELAQRRKLEGHISGIFNKMGQMRSKYPKDIPDSIVNHLHAMGAGDFNWHEAD